MPWCRGCDTEFPDETARCPHCNLPLVPTPPPGLATSQAARHAAGSGLAHAFRYAGGSVRLLRQRPRLLAPPLLVVLLNWALAAAGYYAYSHTAAGQAALAEMAAVNRQAGAAAVAHVPGSGVTSTFTYALSALGRPVQGPTVQYPVQLWAGLALGNPVPGTIDNRALALLMQLLTSLLPTLVFLAGFYGQVGDMGDGRPRGSFWSHARRYSGAFLACGLVVFAATTLLELLGEMFLRFSLVGALLAFWGTLALALPLSLGLVTVVVSGASPLPALRHGASLLARQWPVAAALAAGMLLPAALAVAVREVARAHAPHALGAPGLWAWVGPGIVMALAGAWLVVAQFLWVRAAGEKAR